MSERQTDMSEKNNNLNSFKKYCESIYKNMIFQFFIYLHFVKSWPVKRSSEENVLEPNIETPKDVFQKPLILSMIESKQEVDKVATDVFLSDEAKVEKRTEKWSFRCSNYNFVE